MERKLTCSLAIALLVGLIGRADASIYLSGGNSGTISTANNNGLISRLAELGVVAEANAVGTGVVAGWYGSQLQFSGSGMLEFTYFGAAANYVNRFQTVGTDNTSWVTQFSHTNRGLELPTTANGFSTYTADRSMFGDDVFRFKYNDSLLSLRRLTLQRPSYVFNGGNPNNVGGTANFFVSEAIGGGYLLWLDDGSNVLDNQDDMVVRVRLQSTNPEPAALTIWALGAIGFIAGGRYRTRKSA